MAKFKEINFLLKLQPGQFAKAAKDAESDYMKVKGKIQEPIDVKVNVQGALQGFAQLGLALNGIKAAYQAIAGPAKELVDLSNFQERADLRLRTALKIVGDESEEAYKKQRDFATWIQAVTTVGDEQAEMLQALALNMEAPIDKLDEVTKNAIALSKVFQLDMNVAIRASVAALDDDYTMLTRYIPALRTATDETEKAAIFQRTVNAGWVTATEELKSGAGALEDYSNSLGDVKEDIGDFIKLALIPLIRTTKPLLDNFSAMDKGTQQVSLGFLATLAIMGSAPRIINAVSSSLKSLNAALGPTGWIILGLTLAYEGWLLYTSGADDAADANERFKKSTIDLDTSLANAREAARRLYGNKDIDVLLEKQQKYKGLTEESRKALNDLYNLRKTDKSITDEEIAQAERKFKRFQVIETGIAELIKEKQETKTQAAGQLTEEELIELDKRREYEFQSQRISLAQYVAYLGLRKEALKKSLGESSVDYLKFLDKLAELNKQFSEEQRLKLKIDTSGIERASTEAEGLKVKLAEYQTVSTDFHNVALNDIEEEYKRRKAVLDAALEDAKTNYGEDHEEYKKLVQNKQDLDDNYYDKLHEHLSVARDFLEDTFYEFFTTRSANMFEIFFDNFTRLLAKMAAAYLASGIEDFFSGKSSASGGGGGGFNVGDALEVVASIVPFFFAKGGQVTGFSNRGKVNLHDLFQSALTPPGEDGIIGVKKWEYVMPVQPTMRYFPILEAMRRGDYPQVPGYAQGGVVGKTGPAPTADQSPAMDAYTLAAIEDSIVKAFGRSSLLIEGKFDARGQDLETILNKRAELKVTY